MHLLASIGLAAMTLSLVASPAMAAPTAEVAAANPLIGVWTTPDAAPPYNRIRPEHYEPAFDEGMRQARIDLDAIATNSAAPSFANTIEAMERAGPLLDRTSATFFNVAGSDSTPANQQVEEAVTPKLTRFGSDTYLDQRLFGRVDALMKARATLGLTPEQDRLLEITHKRFVRAGAALPAAERTRLAAIDEQMAGLRVKFGQALLSDQKAGDTLLTDAEMQGVPDSLRASAAAKAKAAGKPGYLITASRSDTESFLTVSPNRAARQKVFTAFNMRGDNGNANDTNAIIADLVKLRLERAQMLGYKTHADFVLDNSMAQNPKAATDLMMQVYAPAREKALAEEADLLKLAKADGITSLEPWDWRFYAEKVRTARFAFDEGQLKQYLPLDGMVKALFETTNRLFGLSMVERSDIPVWQTGVRVWEVRGADGKMVGLFYADWFARDTKRPGAWMNEIRGQNGLLGLTPQVVNNCNFTPPAAGERALLSFDDAQTLFHEFGHALHGLLSKTRYPSVAGTSVYRDFVEFPSQIYEHWASEPDNLRKYAVNAKGEAMPDALLTSLLAARTFDQGNVTVQQLSSALVDMELHNQTSYPADFNARSFEAATLKKLGVPHAVGMRHRLAHFSHLFDGGYDAGYYAYTWAEVLEADGFDAFKEAGSAWDAKTALAYRTEVLERGNSRDPGASYVAFRGRMPTADALLRNRGLK